MIQVRVGHPFLFRAMCCLLSTILYVSLFMQNDLVHGWGLDFALRKCVEVHCSFSLVAKFTHWGSMNVCYKGMFFCMLYI